MRNQEHSNSKNESDDSRREALQQVEKYLDLQDQSSHTLDPQEYAEISRQEVAARKAALEGLALGFEEDAVEASAHLHSLEAAAQGLTDQVWEEQALEYLVAREAYEKSYGNDHNAAINMEVALFEAANAMELLHNIPYNQAIKKITSLYDDMKGFKTIDKAPQTPAEEDWRHH